MKLSFKILSGILAALIFSAVVAYAIVSLDIEKVSDFEVKQRTETSQTLFWNKCDVSGYNIYQKNAKNDEFQLIKKVEDQNINEFTINSLDMETFYVFKISSYVDFLGISTESDLSSPLRTCTVPRSESISEVLSANNNNSMNVSWTKNSNCDGYEIQYSKDNEFKNSDNLVLPNKTSSCSISNLKINTMYYFRVRTYLNLQKEKVYSDYSKTSAGVIGSKIDISKYDLSKPMIALTFDDGPDYGNTSNSILKTLQKYNSKATFFMVGDRALSNKANLQKKVKIGCELGNHTYGHDHYGSSVTASDIKKCSQAIYKATGQYPTSFRSTGGFTTSVIKRTCKNLGMPLFYWTIDTRDWESKNADKVYNNIMKAKDGDIILMHDIYGSTAEAIAKAVPKLIKKGYQLVTVSELVLAKSGAQAKPGTEYVSATRILDN